MAKYYCRQCGVDCTLNCGEVSTKGALCSKCKPVLFPTLDSVGEFDSAVREVKREAKIEALREAREQLSKDCIEVTRKYENSKDPHERVNAGWASYAHGFLRCRLDIMIKQLESE